MAEAEDQFRALLEGIRSGSQEAVRQFLQRYGKSVLTVIRQKLDVTLRPVFDSVDFLQDVWLSFFRGELGQHFPDPGALEAYLAAMARNKVADVVRLWLQGKTFSLNRERSLDGSARGVALRMEDQDHGPSERAMCSDEWDRLLSGMPFHHRRILTMLREGHTHEEIAAALGIHERTVRRLIQKLTGRDHP